MADPNDYLSTLSQSVLDSGVPDTTVTADTPETENKRTLSEAFSDGMLQGVEGMAADVEYFKALAKTLVGADEESIADNIAEARRLEESASLAVKDMDTFGEFLENPTVTGFIEQAVKFSGQAVPSIATTVSSGGVGGVAAVLGKKGVGYTGKKIAERIGRDSIERTIKGTATPDERDLANSLYRTFRNGSIGGAFTAEYIPLSGSNLGEALDSGQELDKGQAARAALVGVPQATIGVAGEVAIVKLLGNIAKKRAVKESSTFGDFAKLVATNTLRTGTIEGTTEFTQEGLGILNRMDLDPTYTAEEAQLRLAEAAFGGFMGGAPVGGAGTVVATGVRKVAEAGVLDATADVMDKARRMMDEKRGKDINDTVDGEQYGDVMSGTTTPESQADINAQLKAMVDPTSTKKSVWQAGDTPALKARTNTVTPVTVDGKRAFAAFIPGRGTIISTNESIVQEVIKSRASDGALAIALGYSQSKSEVGNSDIVVQAFDVNGNVVSEEVTSQENLQEAMQNAEGLKPDGGFVSVTTLQQALETRAKKYQQEQGPDIRDADVDDSIREMNEDDLFDAIELAKGSKFKSVTVTRPDGTRVKIGLADLTAAAEKLTQGKKRSPKNNDEAADVPDPLTSSVIEDAYGYIIPLDRVINEGDGFQSPWLSADGKIIGTGQDHLAFAGNASEGLGLENTGSYSGFMRQTNAIRFSAFEDASTGDYVVSIHTFEGQKLTQAQLDVLRKINTARGGKVKLLFGASDTQANPNYEQLSLDDFLSENNAATPTQPSDSALDTEPDQETDIENQEGVQTLEGEETVTGTYEPKADRNQTFDNTQEARDDYDATFGAQDWSTAEIGEATESTLREAVRQQRANKNAVVTIRKNSDGKFEVVRTSFDSNLIELVDPVDKKVYRVTEAEFLDRAIKIAKKSKFKNIVLVTPDGKRIKVNLADLTRAGQRLSSARGDGKFEGQTPFEAARKGLQEILTELRLEGYDVVVSGESIFDIGNQPVPDYQGSTVAAVINGKQVTLGELLSPPQTIPEQRPEAVIAEDVDSEGRPTGERVAVQSGTDEAMDAFERFQRDVMGRETRRVNQEFDPADQVQETDGRSEVDRMLDQPETAQDADRQTDRRTGRAPTTNNQAEPTQPNRPQAEPEVVAGVEESFLVGLINNLRKAIKLKNPPRVFTYENLVNMTMGELEQQFGAENVNQILASVNRIRESNGNLRGMHVTLLDSGSKANLIILNESGNTLRDAAVLAHEFGHALFREEMTAATANPALRARLLRAFEKDPRYQNYLNAYDYELAFEEWYADQVARWATKKFINKQAKSLTDKHFKELAKKLKAMYREFTRTMKRRLGNTSQDFETYIEAVVDAKKKGYETAGTSANPNFVQKAMVQEVNQAVVKMGGEALADHWRGALADIARSPKLRPLMKLVRTADGIMRLHGGRKIADMFYIRSQDPNADGGLGFVGASARQIAEFQNKFEEQVGSMDDPEVQAALLEAMGDEDTDQLSPKAQQVRKFLESIYDDYIAPSNTDIGRQQNYFPTALNLMAIQENLDGFVELIMQQDPTANEAEVRKSINAVLRYNQSVADGKPIDIDGTDPAVAVEKALQLTLNVNRRSLYDAGFLHEPQDAFVQYVRHVVKRVEWNKHTKDEQGNDLLEAEMNKLSPEDKEVVQEIIATHLGYQTNPLSPMWRKVNSYGQFLQFVTILPFAAIASLPELAGPVINSKEFGGLIEGLKQIPATIKNRAEARQLARDLGVVTNEIVANSWVTQAELDYMDPKVRKMSDVFFKYTALQWFTTFSREFAAGMGVQFILKHARNEFDNPRSERYLQELGLTAKEVMAWNDSGRKFTTPEGKKIKRGLQRFVESSILRPNSAERPVWASDPHWALVWQLKSYFYAYGKVIMGGIYREMVSRRKEMGGQGMPQLTATLSVLAITALATMPLAMLGMELREYTKQGLAAVLPGVEMDNKYFRTDRMDWPTYLTEVIDKSGFLGIFTLGAMSHQNAKWDDKGIEGFAPDAILPFLGPTAETVDTILENGFSIDRTLKNRLIPIYNQL